MSVAAVGRGWGERRSDVEPGHLPGSRSNARGHSSVHSSRLPTAGSVAESSGLVRQVTTVQLPHSSLRIAFRDMNKRRRIRRMRRVVIGAADATRAMSERGGRRMYTALVTLTYAGDGQWSSEHISRYIKRTRAYLSSVGVPCLYQWVMELTQRGRPHYHILWWLPVGTKIPKPDESGHWSYGMSNIKKALRPVGYLVKYATKGGIETGELPKGARLFGVGHGGDESVRHAARRFGLPTWLHESSEEFQVFKRIPRLGWVCSETGEFRATPFSVVVSKDSWGLIHITITQR